MQKILTLLSIVTFTSCHSYNKLYSNYAEAKKLPATEANTVRIFIDREGTIYPDKLINEADLRRNETSLRALYKDDSSLFTILLRQYNVVLSSQDFDTTFNSLQKAIEENIINQINNKINGYSSVTFLIHGINNSINKNDNASANPLANYQVAEDTISNYLKTVKKTTAFVEVYWDGMHKINFFDVSRVWGMAQTNSYPAGLVLRKIIGKINKSNVVVITHSLGANVISETLFNQLCKIRIRHNSGFRNSLQRYYNDSNYNTPRQNNLRIGLVAPAMPGLSTFKNFANRTGVNYNEIIKDNYSIWSGYNTKDKVLGKIIPAINIRIRWLVYLFGATSLGATKKENDDVKKLFYECYKKSFFDAIDFTKFDLTQNQKDHPFTKYLKNMNFKNY